MDPRGQKQRVLRFGIFELDVAAGELRKGGVPVRLQSQPLQLLMLLTGRPGQVVTREEIRQALWGGGTFVDFDQSINFCVNKLRDALDDDPQRPRCIETVPRKGYRFVAAIVESGPGPAEAAPARRPQGLLLAGAVLALVVIALAARTAMLSRIETKAIQSLAVLPFENLSADPEQQYFADGMTDDLITDLAKISAVRVLSRTSVMQYKSTKKPIPQIARELNVDAVLEGTVTRDGDRVRITVQLIRADPEKHLWADRYEEGLGGILTLQDNVAKAVAREIRIKVTPREQLVLAAPRKIDPSAYELYLRGRYLWEQRSGEESLMKSCEYLEKAIEKDPGYALAWNGLADSYEMLASWGVVSRRDSAPRARAAAEKALELDNSLVGPVVTLAVLKMNYEWDWAGAERLFKRAIDSSPNYGLAHEVYATYLAEVGRVQEAVTEARRAFELEPLNFVSAGNVIWKLYLAHQYDEAELECRKFEARASRPPRGFVPASVWLRTGHQQEGIAELRKYVVGGHPGVLELMYLGHALGTTGARAEGRKVLDEMLALSQRRYVPPDYIAMVYEGLGDRERALQWFEKAVAERSMNGWILPDPRLDQIRSDPRFQNLMRRMGLLR